MDIREEIFQFDKKAKKLVDDLLNVFQETFPNSVAGDSISESFFRDNMGIKSILTNFSLEVIEKSENLSVTEQGYVLRRIIKINKREIARFKKNMMTAKDL